MSTAYNKALFQRYIDEVWHGGKYDVVDEIFASDHKAYDPQNPEYSGDPESTKQHVRQYMSAFPDARFEVEAMIAEGDMVSIKYTVRGTHTGPLGDIQPTNKEITLNGVEIIRVANGKIAQSWSSWDALGMLQQLGVIPAMG